MATSIRQGDVGDAVRDVQQRLARSLQLPLAADGEFGSHTRTAVQQFQRLRGLTADGVVGPETWRELVEAGYSLGDRLLWRASRMMRGDDVRDLQRRLNQLGFDAGPEDGIFGPLAHGAVEEFQRNVGLDVDGVAGPETIELLLHLRRDHQAGGGVARVREREWLRRLAGRGLTGARILVDPARGPADPGHRGPSGLTEDVATWEVARRVAARLAAQGADVLLSRGPTTTPSPSGRARLANEQGVEIVLSFAMNALATPAARGSSAYYFGSSTFTSEAGRVLAAAVQDAAVAAGWLPDGRTHGVTWSLLRETRMPAVVLEPAFITAPADEARLRDPGELERLAASVSAAVAGFFEPDHRAAHAPRDAVAS